MTDIVPFLKTLLTAPGLSGFEDPVSQIIEDRWRPLVDEISSSRLGSLHALRKATGTGKHPSLMIATHMDAIGLMVKKIENGLIKVTHVGGVDARILPGQAVVVHAQNEWQGVVQMLPDRLVPSRKAGDPPDFDSLFVDIGLSEIELEKNIRIGDTVSFAQAPVEFSGGYVSGHSLDNRASVAALTVCLEELKNYNLQFDLWSVATVQEEEFLIGATTSSFQIQPDIGIAVDVTFAKGPGSNDYQTFPLGKGISIGLGANIHPALYKQFKGLAEELDMPHCIETMPRSSGTDGMGIQITAAGIPTMVLGIPIRYMHTPVELVAINDILRAGRLLAKFITNLEANSLATLFEVKS